MQNPQNTDKDSLAKVERYMQLDAANTLEVIVTICQMNHDYMIVDGNKRASALYEGHSDNNFTPVPVYLVFC